MWIYCVVDNINTTGWAELEIEATSDNSTATGNTAAVACGFLEGWLTYERLYQTKLNWFADMFSDTSGVPPEEFLAFLKENIEWVFTQIAAHQYDPFWQNVDIVYAQVEGIYRGYSSATVLTITIVVFIKMQASLDQPITLLEFYILNAAGDVGDVLSAVVPGFRKKPFSEMTAAEMYRDLAKRVQRLSEIANLLGTL